MTVNKSNGNTQSAAAIQKINNQSSVISPLSSRYTYAIGSDGKRYVLQLMMDTSSVNNLNTFSSFA